MRFLSTFGILQNTWANLTLIVASGLAEGFGLAMFIPLLHLMGQDDPSNLEWPFSLIVSAFEWTGLSVTLIHLLVVIGVLVFASLILGYVQRVMLARAKHRFAMNSRGEIIDRLLRAKWEHSSRQAHGEVINHLVTECGRAGNALGYEVMAVATAILIAVYTAFSFVISWKLMAIVLVFTAFIWMALRPLTHRAKKLGDEANEANRGFSLSTVDYLRSLKLIKATATDRIVANRLSNRNDSLFQVVFQSETNLMQVYFVIQGLAALLVIVIAGFGHAVFQTPAAETLVFLVFLIRLAPRLAQLQQQYQSYLLAIPAYRVVRDALAGDASGAEDLNPGGCDFAELRQSIVLDNVGYSYPDSGAAAVSNISFTIRQNDMVAIVGKSGAGKSTLMDLIGSLRLPDAGKLLVDGTDIREISLTSYRRRIGLVSQETIIFNDTLRNNLLFCRPDTPAEILDHALEVAQLKNFVASLPDGLETVLGEGGGRLSGGQRQRVALARALVIEPDILLLDEATSALDNESERAVQNAIEEIAHRMTIVVIAHRLSTVRKADVIHVMEGGRGIESGTYQELLTRGGRFSKLHESQFS